MLITRQVQDQKYANFTMATVLSTAENIVWRTCSDKESMDFLENEYSKLDGYISGKLIFDSYDAYRSGKEKHIDSLINQFIIQIDNFKDDYKEFKKLYKDYLFPDNITKQQIINILDIWLTIIDYKYKEIKKYFISLKTIIEGFPDNSISLENEIREKIKKIHNNKSGRVDPNIIKREYANALRIIEEKTKDITHQKLELWK